MNGVSARRPSTVKVWSRALTLTAPIVSRPERTLPAVIDELAIAYGDAPALLSEDEWLTFADLARQSRRYARWALAHGLHKGDAVALLMPNQPEYLAMWLGITRAGGVAALVSTELPAPALVHCLNLAAPKHVIVHAELADRVDAVRLDLGSAPTVWMHGGDGGGPFPRIADHLDRPAGPEESTPDARVTIADRALYIYTSGTTGLPKAAIVSHARLMQWTHWFAGLMDVGPADRMYNCLPMYHSAGGVVATGAVLVGGGSVVIGRRFSARRFWEDVVGWDCTLFQYIGELCRYLVNTAPHACEMDHRLRLCAGNGLRRDVWDVFQSRFRIPQILEFYASTEGNVSLANVEGRPGAIGRIPAFLAHRFPAALVKYDEQTAAPLRDASGLCVPCAPHEAGEAIGRLETRANVGSWFEGYTDEGASRQRILRDVFEPGDTWCRTGDLMRRDERGYFYFVDRIGDTFRWKGENVATTEVVSAICRCPGITEAVVYGVPVPGADGRAGMAAVATSGRFDPAAFRAHVTASLPHYARPLFVRVCDRVEATSTFKHTTTALMRDGYDPARIADALYVDDGERQAYVRLDTSLYDRIQSGLLPGVPSPCSYATAT
jgi:fatty-acyl-CoA synthase